MGLGFEIQAQFVTGVRRGIGEGWVVRQSGVSQSPGPCWADLVFCSIDFPFSADGVVCASLVSILLKQVRLFLALWSGLFAISAPSCLF